MVDLPYLRNYSSELRAEVRRLLESGELATRLEQRYPDKHDIRSNRDLHDYVQEIKSRRMRTAPPLGKVSFDDRLHSVHNALGLHVTTTRLQGAHLRKRRELRVASLFKDLAPEFLHMIVVHELAHIKHAQHDEDFYKLCTYMEPDYHRLELDLRLLLTVQEREV